MSDESSLPRKRPAEDEDSGPSTLPPARVLAGRELFFVIHLRPASVYHEVISSLSEPQGDHALANKRINGAIGLSDRQRASLTALLVILNDYFPVAETTGSLNRYVAAQQTDDVALASMAEKIEMGLKAFLATGGSQDIPTTPIALGPTFTSPAPSAADAPPAAITPTPSVATTAVPSKRAKTSHKSQSKNPSKSGASSRSHRVRTLCKQRDGPLCRLCNYPLSLSAHIIPFSLRGTKALDFWAFIALFRPDAAILRAAALAPTPHDADTLSNVLQLCTRCHELFDKPLLGLVPCVLEDPAIAFPYDPAAVQAYDVVVDFPAGTDVACVAVRQPDRSYVEMSPGHIVRLTTPDPVALPLPHPLLLQLHVVCGRLVVMRAAAGYPVVAEDSDDDTVYDLAEVDVRGVEGFEQKEWSVGREDGPRDLGVVGETARDPEVVMMESEQRGKEREELFRQGLGRTVGTAVGVGPCCPV